MSRCLGNTNSHDRTMVRLRPGSPVGGNGRTGGSFGGDLGRSCTLIADNVAGSDILNGAVTGLGEGPSDALGSRVHVRILERIVGRNPVI